ncbi:hypothetical protein LY76DRAFT_666621 [Colletotrichum caudatum]|nr:hypothetical protein LY76DRAFT_666621 [Colletotrichum caudatum]
MASQPPPGIGPVSATGMNKASRIILPVATNDGSTTAEKPTISLTAASGPAIGSVLSALDEEARQKLIAKEASGYVIQALRKLIKCEIGSTADQSWAAVAASATVNATVAMLAPTRPQAPLPAHSRSQAQPQEDLCIFARILDEGYSLKPANNQVPQRLLADKQALADCLGAYKVETPPKWFTYVVYRCPTKLRSIDEDILDPAADSAAFVPGQKTRETDSQKDAPLSGLRRRDILEEDPNARLGYADDIGLLATSPSLEGNVAILSRRAADFLEWGDVNKVSFDPSKCKAIHFSRKLPEIRAGNLVIKTSTEPVRWLSV